MVPSVTITAFKRSTIDTMLTCTHLSAKQQAVPSQERLSTKTRLQRLHGS